MRETLSDVEGEKIKFGLNVCRLELSVEGQPPSGNPDALWGTTGCCTLVFPLSTFRADSCWR